LFVPQRICAFRNGFTVSQLEHAPCDRCLTTTLGYENKHDPSFMIDPDHFRPVRKVQEAKDILEQCAAAETRAARERLTDLLAIWPETPSLMSISHFHAYLQTVGDTLHILDGGTTERILLYIGNWLFDSGEGNNWEAVQLINRRLAASPPQQEFKHFVQPLFAKNDDAKASTAHQRIKMAANWRCEEFAALLPQMAYLLKDHTAIANVLTAYADLYKTLRDVAPLLKNVTTAMREYAEHARTKNCNYYTQKPFRNKQSRTKR